MKLLNKFEKFEEFANKILNKTLSRLLAKLISLIPAFVFRYYHQFKNSIIQNSIKIYQNTKVFILKLIVVFNKYKEKIFLIIDKIQAIPVKTKTFELLEKINQVVLKTPLKVHAQTIRNFLKNSVNSFSLTLKKYNNPQSYIATVAILMIGVGTFSIYKSGNKIYTQEFPNRTPASVQEYVDHPQYQQFPKRTLKVFNVKVPIFQKSISSIRSVTIDFSVRTDTRFAKQFLEEFEYKLKDYFFLTVEPVVSEFPLEEEGKSILKDKIQRELNQFLKQHKVEGKVIEVKLIYIIAS